MVLFQQPRLGTRQRKTLTHNPRTRIKHARTDQLHSLISRSSTSRRSGRHPIRSNIRIKTIRNLAVTDKQRQPRHFHPRPPKPRLPPLRALHETRLTHPNRISTRSIRSLNPHILRRQTRLRSNLQTKLTQLLNKRGRRSHTQLLNLRRLTLSVLVDRQSVTSEDLPPRHRIAIPVLKRIRPATKDHQLRDRIEHRVHIHPQSRSHHILSQRTNGPSDLRTATPARGASTVSELHNRNPPKTMLINVLNNPTLLTANHGDRHIREVQHSPHSFPILDLENSPRRRQPPRSRITNTRSSHRRVERN